VDSGTARRREDGAVVFDVPGAKPGEPGSEKVLLRADGTSVYITQDLGSLMRRISRHSPKKTVWVVGSEQELHFELLFQIIDRFLPGTGDSCVHLSYGMVELPHGKMKSREGDIVEADGFLTDVEAAAAAQLAGRYPDLDAAEVARRAAVITLAAVKYQLLKYSKRSTVKFDVEAALDMNGKTGPYCLYALARLRSILRKLADQGLSVEPDPTLRPEDMADEEAALCLTVGRFPEQVALAVRDLEPFHVADFVYKLAKSFNAYYTATTDGRPRFPVVQCANGATRRMRTTVLRNVEAALEIGLSCLGIETLDSM
jgi:arginyl-tRNA synthetase